MARPTLVALLVLVLLAGPAAGPAPAQTTGPAGLGELWERYPLEDEGAVPPTPSTPADAAQAPPAVPPPVNVAPSSPPADPGGGSEWIPLVVLLVSLLVLGAAIRDHVRSRRRAAAGEAVDGRPVPAPVDAGPAVALEATRPEPAATRPEPAPARPEERPVAEDAGEPPVRAPRPQPGAPPRHPRRAAAADAAPPTGRRPSPLQPRGVLPAKWDPRRRP